MHKLAAILTLGFITIAPSFAFAADDASSDYYVGYRYGFSTFGVELDSNLGSSSGEVEPKAISGVLGYEFNRLFAVEARLMLGAGDDDVSLSPLSTSAGIDVRRSIGIYAVGKLSGGSLYAYGMLGAASTEVSFSVSGIGSNTKTEDEVSAAVGVGYDINDWLSVELEYLHMFDVELFSETIGTDTYNADYDLNVISLGMKIRI